MVQPLASLTEGVGGAPASTEWHMLQDDGRAYVTWAPRQQLSYTSARAACHARGGALLDMYQVQLR